MKTVYVSLNSSINKNSIRLIETVLTRNQVNVVPVGGISETVETTDKDEWSQEQQKLLEIGLKKHGKELSDRWDRIAADVIGKDKVSRMIEFTFSAFMDITVSLLLDNEL